LKAFKTNVKEQITSVLSAVARSLRDESAIQVFVDMRLLDSLPIADERFSDLILDVLHPLFSKRPSIFQPDFARRAGVLLEANAAKSLVLLAIYAASYTELSNPLPILDLLLQSEHLFERGRSQFEYISLLAFLNCTHEAYRKARLAQCRPIFCHFLASTHKPTARLAYQTISALVDDHFDLPFDQIANDLSDKELSPAVVSLLLRVKVISPLPDLIRSLVRLTRENGEATLVLLRLIGDSSEAAELVISVPNWLHPKLPTLTDSMRLVLAVIKYNHLRAPLSSLPGMYDLLHHIIVSGDPVAMACLGSITKRLELTDQSFTAFARLRFVRDMVDAVLRLRDDAMTQLAIEVVTLLGMKGYLTDFLDITGFLADCLRAENEGMARTAFIAFFVLSRHPECAVAFQKLALENDIRRRFGNDRDRKKVNRFFANLQKTAR
jgi:hypothetical protein